MRALLQIRHLTGKYYTRRKNYFIPLFVISAGRHGYRYMNKKERQAQALKKAKQIKMLTVGICVSVALVITALLVFHWQQQRQNRVYTDGHQTVTLRGNGAFTAVLAHETRTGTYAESAGNDAIIVTFISEGESVNGKIANDLLFLPEEWDDGHGHVSQLMVKPQ